MIAHAGTNRISYWICIHDPLRFERVCHDPFRILKTVNVVWVQRDIHRHIRVLYANRIQGDIMESLQIIPEKYRPQIILGDCREVMANIPQPLVDLTVTSPPYNLDMGYDNHKDSISWDEYLAWSSEWLEGLYRVTRDGGRLCLNVPLDKNKGGQQATYSDLLTVARAVGWKYHSTVIWNEGNVSRRTAWGCYDKQTDVLTNKGFKKFYEVNLDQDQIATINLNTKTFEYQKGFEFIKYPFNGQMYSLLSKTFDLLITPNHNLIFTDFSGNFKLCEVELYFKDHNSISIPQKIKSYNEGQRKDWFYLPKIIDSPRSHGHEQIDKIPMDDWLMFLGIFVTDGNCYHSIKNRQYKTSIYQSKKEHLNELKQLLERLPFSFTYKSQKSEFYTCNKQLTSYLTCLKNKNNRMIPEWILTLHPDQIKIFLKWVMIGDGSISHAYKAGRIAVPSTQMSEYLTHLMIQNGQPVSNSIHKHQGGRNYHGTLIRGDMDLNLITLKTSANYFLSKNRGNITKQPYCGDVYCISVPNQTLCVRRNGKITWCGNSWMSASAPYVIAPVETILILYKGETWKKPEKGVSDITREEFIAWTNGLWTFNGESAKRTGHPAPFPVELPHRCIKLFSYVDDIIFDPFLGSGSTLVAAAMNGRKAIGIDISAKYVELARNRIAAI